MAVAHLGSLCRSLRILLDVRGGVAKVGNASGVALM